MAEESLYKRRVAQGLCGSCGKEPSVPGKSLGASCLQKSKDKAAAKRAKQRAAGLCVESGCKEPAGRGGRCDYHNDYQKAGRQDRIDRKKAAGICVQEGCQEQAKEGCVLCQEHIDKRSKVSSAHYRRRKEEGLCRFGNHPALPGRSMCAYHEKQHKDYRKKLKLEVMEQYGGPWCSWPGCTNENLDELQLHHVDGGGNAHRKELGLEGGSYNFHLWLRNEGYPPGYRVLCPTHHVRADNALKTSKSSSEAPQ